jgi:hypothetical protein
MAKFRVLGRALQREVAKNDSCWRRTRSRFVCLRSPYFHLSCENSDGNAIVAWKQLNTPIHESGWQNKNAFRFDVVRRKGDSVSVVIQLAQDLSRSLS